MTHKHRTTWFLSRLLAILLLLGANPIWAQPTIPQDLLDMIAEQGSARVIVGLDVPWQPEGLLNQRQVAAQRRDLTATQSQFVETLSQDLADDGLIDSPHSPDGTPTVKAARTFETVPYLVFEVNSITLPYVQNTPKAKTLQLSVPDEPTMSDSLPLIGADKAWDSGHTGAGQAIAIIDTGVDKTHTAFAPARIITEACFSVTHCPNGKPEQTSELGAAQPCEFDPEGCGHGTHVAGIAAGTAPDAQIIAVQAASEFFGKASFYRDDQIAALDWLHTNRESFGVPLAAINMSVGGKKSHSQPCDDDPRTKIIQNLESVGIATIISAGNNGYPDGISAPACISKAISVGATDKTGQLWPQSNRADFLDLLAPGVGIESALPGDLTAAKDGTSMAAPHVAGAWAIMKAHNPQASVAEVLAMLKETGQEVEGMPRIQIDAALPQVHAPQGLNDGLVAYYTCDGNANDASGNGNHGTVNGTIEYVEGYIGEAARFRKGYGFIRVPNPTQLFDTQYTISGWLFSEGKGGSVINKYKWGVPGGGKGFGLTSTTEDLSGLASSGSTFFTAALFNEGWNPSKYPKYTMQVGEFKHLTAVYDTGNMKLYIDGILESEKSIQHSNSLDNPYDILIGTYVPPSQTFEGLVDELRIYNRALSESEIKQLYELDSEATLTLTKTGEGEITSTDNSINCGETCEADYEVESTVTLTATPATGYSFTGWSGDCAGASPTTIVTMDAAKSCTAHFDKSSGLKTITVNKEGKGKGSVKIDIRAEDRMHLCKTDCSEMTQPIFTANEIVLTATPAKGFILKQWAGDCSGTDNQITVPMTASKTCTADFDLDPNAEMYALTVNKEGSQGRLVAKGGIDCGENCTAYYPGGQKVRLEARFNEADTLFLGWKGDCSGFQNQVYVTMDADKSCSASFKPYNPAEEFALNVNNGGDGLGTITERVKGDNTSFSCRGKAGCKQSQHQYASGSQVLLSAIPETGFEFTGGSGDCAWESDTDNNGRLRGTATVIMDQAKTCTAEFGLKADLTWHKLTFYTAGTGNGSVNNPARIDCGNQCTADYYEAGKTFWLKAEPTALSQFMGWSGDCEGKGSSQKITLDQDKTCIAQFKSDFEILADEMVEAFYATATSSDGTPIGEIYPQPENQARLKEAFWVTITAILQTDQSLILSNEQNWPTQFDGINWLPSDSSTQYTDSVQVVAKQFVGIEVELLDQNGSTEKMGIVIYYGEEAPIIDDGVWSRRIVRVAIFSRYAFRRW